MGTTRATRRISSCSQLIGAGILYVLSHSVSYVSLRCYLAVLARIWRSQLFSLLARSSLPSSVAADDLPSGSLAPMANH